MSRTQLREDGKRVIIIEEEPENICEICGEKAETRPYGPNGEEICIKCADKDEITTRKMMRKKLFGIEE